MAVRDENAGEILCDNKGKLTVSKNHSPTKTKHAGDKVIKQLKIFELEHQEQKRFINRNFILIAFNGRLYYGRRCGHLANPDFQVHGEKTLYIADSSIFLNVIGHQSGLTIKSLGHKLAQQLIK
ncbi:MAG: hypothetical protein R2807_05835 [Chitinophagales bacterium]